MSDMCQTCGARCCRYFCFQIDNPTSYQEFENVRWFLMHEGVSIHIDVDGDWYIAIANRCKALGPDQLCINYKERPLICRFYDTDGCDFTQGEYEYQSLFTTPEQIEQYARMKLGPARFDKIKAAARARMARQAARRAKEAKRKIEKALKEKALSRTGAKSKQNATGKQDSAAKQNSNSKPVSMVKQAMDRLLPSVLATAKAAAKPPAAKRNARKKQQESPADGDGELMNLTA